MKWIKFISSLVISYVLGFTLNKGLSATNIVENSATEIILNYNLPFIYTVRLNEIAIIISLTIVGFFIVCSYYEKSESSLEEIFKIMIKVLWSELFLFSFIIGTWTDNLLKKLEKDSFCYIYDWNILFFSISVIIFLYICFNQNRIKDKFKVKKESDLYSSRKILLPIIDEYLESIESISIIGDWGIGKSKLIENFFHAEKDKENKKYSDKYESIIIDVSSYSENKKIISVIQEELVKILMKHKIFKININFVEKVFVENNDFLKSIKNIFFCKDSLIESKEELNKKIKELYEKKEKRIVLCLDNLERLSDVDRIKNLLSIIDDLLGKEIKKIYLYDKKYMKNIFNKDQCNFDEYIEKYVFNEIKVNPITSEEILEENKRIRSHFIKLKNRMDETLRVLHILLTDHKILDNIGENKEIFSELMAKKINEINYKLSNPRFLIHLKEFIVKKEENIYERLEYKIINYFFQTVTLESIEKMTLKELIKPNIFEESIISKEKMNILVEKKLFEQMFLSEENFEFTELNLQEKKAIYTALFLNQKKKQINLKKEYFKIVKNLKMKENISVSDILNINKIMSLTDKKSRIKYKREVKKILRKYGKNIDIIINFNEIRNLLKIEGIEFYSEKKEIKILKSVYVDDNKQKEMVVMSALKYYFIEEDFFDNLFQFDNKQNYKEKVKIKEIEDLFKILNKENKEEFIKKVKEILEKHKIHINKINQNKRGYTYKALSKKIDFIEKIFNIEVSDLEVVLNDIPVQLYILKASQFLYYSEDLLNRIIIKEDSMEFDLHEMERSFVLKRNHIKKMKKKLEELEVEEEVITSFENIRKFKRIKNIILSELYRFEKNI